MIARTVLVLAGGFGQRLNAARVAEAIGRGLEAGGPLEPDLCPIDASEDPGDVGALLEALDFDARMHRARAVVIGERRLDQRTLAGSIAFEVATRARQAGVPVYAIAGSSALDPFQARILDLQEILQASSERGLTAAAGKLAGLL